MDWDEMARPWLEAAPDLEAAFVEIFDELFASAALKQGQKVMDVGCGTGPTLLRAAESVGDQGRIVGVDIAPPLIDAAKKRIPQNVELLVGDAGSFEFEKGAYDAIIANFGVMFFDDNIAGFENLRTAIKPEGRLAATVWATPPENPWFSMPRRIVDRFVENVPRPDPAGPGPMRFGDPSHLEDILKASGWAPNIRTVDLTLRPPGSAEQVADLHMKVTVGMMLKGVDVEEQTLAQIRTAIVEECAEYDKGSGIAVPAKIHVVEAIAA